MSTHPDLKFNTPAWQPERDPEYNLLVEPERVFRGGSWSNVASSTRVAVRFFTDPSFRVDYLGLRLVRDIMTAEVAK